MEYHPIEGMIQKQNIGKMFALWLLRYNVLESKSSIATASIL